MYWKEGVETREQDQEGLEEEEEEEEEDIRKKQIEKKRRKKGFIKGGKKNKRGNKFVWSYSEYSIPYSAPSRLSLFRLLSDCCECE